MKKRILVIDDDTLITKVITQILSTIGGFDASAVNNPQKALETALEVRPDIVVLDYQMPGMSGGEVLAALRGNRTLGMIPAILLSGDNSWSGVEQDEVTRLLPKPLTADALIKLARSILSSQNAPVELAA
jgi:CheY-like chemotaxis protein